jgi:cation:H+ antiporter
MSLFDFKDYSLWINIAIFAVSAIAVWIAGTKVARYADAIASKTGIGHVAIGMVLLGGVTSLPEVAISIFSAIADNPTLAVNNLLGGVAMQRAILAGVDGFIGREALTVIVASPVVLLQAALGTLILIVVAAAVALGDAPVFNIGIWSWMILALYIFSIWTISNSKGRQPWIPQDSEPHASKRANTGDSPENHGNSGSLTPVIVKTVAAAAVILIAGFFLSRTADAIAVQTGLGVNFVGAVLLAFSTSLPELSTVISSVRLRQYEMAISDILGTNLFNVALIFLIDAVYIGKPVLSEVGKFSLIASLLGALLTMIYLIGLVERRDRTIGRMGVDSLATLIVYFAGVFVLYRLR